jgi:hypothetical protein
MTAFRRLMAATVCCRSELSVENDIVLHPVINAAAPSKKNRASLKTIIFSVDMRNTWVVGFTTYFVCHGGPQRINWIPDQVGNDSPARNTWQAKNAFLSFLRKREARNDFVPFASSSRFNLEPLNREPKYLLIDVLVAISFPAFAPFMLRHLFYPPFFQRTHFVSPVLLMLLFYVFRKYPVRSVIPMKMVPRRYALGMDSRLRGNDKSLAALPR